MTDKAFVPQRAENAGVIACEIYTPELVVNQTELEKHDGVGAGKYTIGLGQKNMGFCADNEDIHSICLTAVQRLMEKHNIAYTDVGRLEVGTETIVDKSKSVKSVLMQLFGTNTQVEGVDNKNACYGGTQAIFNSIDWMESSSWDGRYAIVVMADIAVYAQGPARPTGGCGAVAVLLGPNAPLVMEQGLRSVHMEHAWDFYKPDLSSEFPTVDGALSVQCYMRALDSCYERYMAKLAKVEGAVANMDNLDYCCFHAPYGKLVLKSFARLHFLNARAVPEGERPAAESDVYASFYNEEDEKLRSDRAFAKVAQNASTAMYNEKVLPTLLVSNECGNMYTASVWGGLCSLLAQRNNEELQGKRIMVFSYGSGLTSAMFSFKVTGDVSKLHEKLKTLKADLDSRTWKSPLEYEEIMKLRETSHNSVAYKPQFVSQRGNGYYLDNVDDKYRRSYRFQHAEEQGLNGA